jgi:hypothetical protein
MSFPIAKFAPTAIVLGVVGYCVWPYVAGSDASANADSQAKMPEIAAALLSPKIETSPQRDPFRSLEEVAAAQTPEVINISKSAVKGPPEVSIISKSSAKEPLVAGGTGKNATNTMPETAVTLKQNPSDMKTMLPQNGKTAVPGSDNSTSGMTLGATCVQGDRGLALINGRIYAPGETIKSPGVQEQYKVDRILPFEVSLKGELTAGTLKYRDFIAAEKSSAVGKQSPEAKK